MEMANCEGVLNTIRDLQPDKEKTAGLGPAGDMGPRFGVQDGRPSPSLFRNVGEQHQIFPVKTLLQGKEGKFIRFVQP